MKQRAAPRKIVGDDGPIKPHNPADVLGNFTPVTPAAPDPQIAPGAPTVVRPVVHPPVPGSQPISQIVP